MTEVPQQSARRIGSSAEWLLTAAAGLGRRLAFGLGTAARFLHFAGRRFLADRCLDQAASLSYTTLLSLVPLVALCAVVVSVVPQFQDFRDDIERMFTGNLLPEASSAAVDQFRRFVHKAGRLTGFGVVGLALSAALLLAAIDMAFDTIWRVHRRRAIIVRVLAYGAILALGPLLIVGSLSLQGAILTTGKHLGGVAFTKGVRVAAPGLLVLAEAAALMLLYRFVPTRRVQWRDALLGAIVGVVLLEAVKRGFTLYLQQFSTFQLIYGALAVIPVFLIWLYLCWVAMLFGAEIVAARPEWRSRGEAEPTP
ncbi:MAG TPA: YihY family inner membrane protein [Candidatus Acidoferrum sp.]|nr:YihY family inner membrane protein [Candidatus Acidoferrum sp.]